MSTTLEIPKATERRMILLLNLLDSYTEEKITSVEISRQTGWKDSVVRHDLWLLKKLMVEHVETTINFDGVSNGYKTSVLREAISQALGIESTAKNCCIVGLNRLGAALLDEGMMEGTGFKIKAGFDSNVNRVEILRSTFPLYPTTEMNYVIRHENISLAVLTVADKDAQSMTDRLVKAGITGIVNMTRTVLKVPPQVKVENISVVNALKIICN